MPGKKSADKFIASNITSVAIFCIFLLGYFFIIQPEFSDQTLRKIKLKSVLKMSDKTNISDLKFTLLGEQNL